MYSQANVEIPNIPQVQVKYIDVVFKQPQPFDGLQAYKLDLDACVVVGDVCIPIPGKDQTFTDGRFIASGSNEGSMFIPRASDPPNPINLVLKIQWCPDQNYFLVKLAGQLLEPLRHQATVFSTVSPLANTNSPVEGSACDPYAVGTCGSGTQFPSGLECTCPKFPPGSGIGPVCITGTCKRIPVKGSVCDKNAVGTCGSSIFPSSGLTCKCEVFGPKETCTCEP